MSRSGVVIDESKMAKMTTPPEAAKDLKSALKAMPVKELRKVMAMIESLLPSQKVKNLDLEDELMQQYDKTKDLMDECIGDPDIAPNQKAQVANSVVSTLGHLVKLQEDLRLQQTLKLMESTLIDMIKTLPKEIKDEFFLEYEERAKKAGLM